jgi:adenylylsulfate reductase, subunit B
MAPKINQDLCDQCNVCYNICPQDIFELHEDQPPTILYPNECWYCAACVIDCHTSAISLKLPLQMHVVPSPALFKETGPEEADALKTAAAFSRSIINQD